MLDNKVSRFPPYVDTEQKCRSGLRWIKLVGKWISGRKIERERGERFYCFMNLEMTPFVGLILPDDSRLARHRK